MRERSSRAKQSCPLLPDQAREFDEQIKKIRADRAEKKRDHESSILQQRLWALELSQRERRDALEGKHAAELIRMDGLRQQEKDKMLGSQAAEYQGLLETITIAAVHKDAELPAQLSKYRYRSSRELVNMQENVERLAASGRLKQAAEWQERAVKLEEQETESWRETLLRVALSGDNQSSMLSQLLIKHQVTYNKLLDRQAKQAHSQEVRWQQEMANLEGTFRVDRWKEVDTCKKQAMMRERAERHEAELSSKVKKDAEVGLSNANQLEVVPQRDGGFVWTAPTSFGTKPRFDLHDKQHAGIAKADWELALTCWQWASQMEQVLTSHLAVDSFQHSTAHVACAACDSMSPSLF